MRSAAPASKAALEDKLAEARLADSDASFENFNLSLFSDEPIETASPSAT